MRLLIFTHYSANYGANLSLFNLLQGFQNFDYEFLIIIPEKGPFTDNLDQAKINYKVVPFHPMTYSPIRKSGLYRKRYHKRNLEAFEYLQPIIEDFQPDLIYSNSSSIGLGARLSKHFDIPHVWVLREMVELHYFYKFYPSKDTFIQFLREAKLLIPISGVVQKVLLAPYQIEQYEVIYNGVFSKERFEGLLDQQIEKKDPNKITFLTVGLLHPSKQQSLVLKAFKKVEKNYPNVELLIAGGGSMLYRNYLKLLAFSLGITKKVKFLGYVKNILDLYLQADVVVNASKHEGLGRTTIEAMATEKVVIGLDSGATAELIEDGVTGLIFQDSAEDLQRAMEQSIKDAELRTQIGKNGRKYARKHFIVEDYVLKLHQLFSEMK